MGFDTTALFRGDLPAPAGAPFRAFPKYNFVGGHNDGPSIPVQALTEAATKVLGAEGQTLATYGLQSGPQGYLPLRQFIVDQMARCGGMQDGTDNVLITSGSLQALDLVNALLLDTGDQVIAEAATYGGALSRLARLGIPYRGVNWTADGIDLSHLQELLEQMQAEGRPAKMIYTIPTVQNPTGGVMTEANRHALLQLADRYNCLIFEDDCYADLLWEGARPPTIRALDQARGHGGDSRVIYCGSFSKSIAPALRIGYVMADWPVIAQLLPLKTDAGTGALEQMVLAEFCAAHFDSHVQNLRQTLKRKCEVMMETLAEQFGTAASFETPKGGIFLWITLPETVDTSRLATATAAEGVTLNPGAEWTVDGAAHRHRMRLCFGHPDVDTIREGVTKLAAICHREFGTPERGANTARDTT